MPKARRSQQAARKTASGPQLRSPSMPRILPRLAKEIEKSAGQPKFFSFPRRPRGPKSLYNPPLPAPSFHPSRYERSILLAPQSPVTHARLYVRHKRLPPTLSRQRLQKPGQVDPPRQMVSSEFAWWANPYLRMLASPLRTCISTNRTLPTDLLIRLVGTRVPPSHDTPSSKQQATLSPDGILHPKYVSRKVGGGAYVLCWRKAVEALQKGGYKRISGHLTYSPRLPDYVAHLLRLRVLQEFELLADRLEYAARSGKNLGPHGVVLRRLTYDEWGSMRSTGVMSYENAVAALIVPPLNRDPVTKERPKPSMSALPPEDEEYPTNAPPLSVLLPACSVSVKDQSDILPHLDIPLYNSITAFPSRSQRAALHAFLLRILAAERDIKRIQSKWNKASSPAGGKDVTTSKGSLAFLLCSDRGIARRGDPAAVALALWRLRMYESDGWPYTNSC